VKILIVYYSLSGHNETLARQIGKKITQNEIEEIVDQKNRAGAWGKFVAGYDAMFRHLTKIAVVQNSPRDFDLVVIVSPLWAGKLPPGTRTYITMNRENLQKYAFISVSERGKENRKVIDDLQKTALQSPVALLLLNNEEYAVGAEKLIEEFVLNLA